LTQTAIAIRVDEFDDPGSDVRARGQIDLERNPIRVDRHTRRLQVFVKSMRARRRHISSKDEQHHEPGAGARGHRDTSLAP